MRVESVGRDALRRVIAAGTVVGLKRLERTAPPLRAVIGEWEQRGMSCAVTFRLGGRDPQVQSGERVRVEARRLDGLFQTAATLRRVRAATQPDEPGMYVAQLHPDATSALRVQRRAFYRLPGRWSADVQALPGEDLPPATATAFDLSAGGVLFDLPETCRPEIGRRLQTKLDLGDGEDPLAVTAQIVRRHGLDLPGAPPLWGCRFERLAPEVEQRILRCLHALYRQRVRAQRTEVVSEPEIA